MRRILLATALLLGGTFSAHADSDAFMPVGKHAHSDAALQAATDYCTQTVGPNRNGKPTSPQFKRCMAGRGWRYVRTTREHTYPDPDDTGMMCTDMVMGGRVIGSHCSNH